MYCLLFLIFSIISVECGKSVQFTKYYTSWCQHCKQLKPTWSDLENKYQNDKRVRITEVNCEDDKATCSQNGVRGYPTLILTKSDGSTVPYKGSRSLDSLSDFIEQNL